MNSFATVETREQAKLRKAFHQLGYSNSVHSKLVAVSGQVDHHAGSFAGVTKRIGQFAGHFRRYGSFSDVEYR